MLLEDAYNDRVNKKVNLTNNVDYIYKDKELEEQELDNKELERKEQKEKINKKEKLRKDNTLMI